MSTRTLKLDVASWDIELDAAGRIKTTEGAYATAQDVANIIRLFENEAYFDQRRGIPHFAIDLGVRPSPSVVRSRYRRAAMQVTNVVNAAVEIEGIDDTTREMRGEITLTCADKTTATVEI